MSLPVTFHRAAGAEPDPALKRDCAKARSPLPVIIVSNRRMGWDCEKHALARFSSSGLCPSNHRARLRH